MVQDTGWDGVEWSGVEWSEAALIEEWVGRGRRLGVWSTREIECKLLLFSEREMGMVYLSRLILLQWCV